MEQDWAIFITCMKRSFIHSIDTLAEGQIIFLYLVKGESLYIMKLYDEITCDFGKVLLYISDLCKK